MTESEFTNPIIPGFAPDPSVVLVDGVFFLVNSSFHVFPSLPIYASRDLQSWKQIGNAIHRPSQNIILKEANSVGFPIGPETILVATVGLLAPTIRWHNGTYFIICTNASHTADGDSLNTQNFYVTTKDIWSGNWSNPIFFDFKGIDTSLFFDDDERVYVQGSWREGSLAETICTIRQLEIDIQTGKPLSETKELWKVTAECGTFEHHAISVARSTNIWGPYESYEHNPILTAFGTGEYIQNTGHGELFQDGSGAWWCVCLGIRNESGRYPLGRETFLTPVSWPKGGWPAIEHPVMTFQRKAFAPSANSDICFPQSQVIPQVDFLYIRDSTLEDYDFSADNRKISIITRSTTLATQTGTTSFVGRRQRSLTCTASVTVQLDQEAASLAIQAGLALYKEDMRHTEIYYDYASAAVCFWKELKLKGKAVTSQQSVISTSRIIFRITAEPNQYTFEYRVGEELKWNVLAAMDTLEMTGCNFSSPILGVFASVEGVETGTPVVFDDFAII